MQLHLVFCIKNTCANTIAPALITQKTHVISSPESFYRDIAKKYSPFVCYDTSLISISTEVCLSKKTEELTALLLVLEKRQLPHIITIISNPKNIELLLQILNIKTPPLTKAGVLSVNTNTKAFFYTKNVTL